MRPNATHLNQQPNAVSSPSDLKMARKGLNCPTSDSVNNQKASVHFGRNQYDPDASGLEPFPEFDWNHGDDEDSVDRLASALLDSPTTRDSLEGPSMHKNKTKTAPRLDADRPADRKILLDTSGTRNTRNLPGNPTFRGNGRKSPTIPRKSSRRKLQDQGRKGLSPHKKTALTKSKTGVLTPQKSAASRWNAMRGQKTSELSRPLPGSKTAPLHTYDSPDHGETSSPVDISKKIEDMLAQSKALKPSPKRTSRVARMSSRFAAKATGAWDRLTGKKPVQSTGIRYKISLPLELTQEPHQIPTIRLVENASGMFHPQLQEATSKVEDHGTAAPRTPSTHNVQNRPSSSESSGIDVSFGDPFVDDTQFSLDLDAVLNDRPLAASTPRASRRPVHFVDSSPLLRKAQAPDKSDSSLEDLGTKNSRGESHKGHPLAIAFTPLKFPRPDHMRKKHPSPTKEELAKLSSELQQLGIRPRTPEVDELAYSYVTSASSEQIQANAGKDVADLGLKTPTIRSLKCRIPGPAGSNRSAVRFGIYKVPCGADSSDVDELA